MLPSLSLRSSHGTVPLEKLVSRRRAAKLLRLCPPSPLLPMVTSTPAHQHTSTSTPGYSAACNLWWFGGSSNLGPSNVPRWGTGWP